MESFLIFNGWRPDEPASRDWWVAPVEGGQAVRTDAHRNLSLAPTWQAPNAWAGNHVYYATGSTVEGVNLFRAAIDPKSLAGHGRPEAITTGPGMKLFLSVMPDGRIFFTDMMAEMNAWSVPARTDEAAVSARPQRLTRDRMQNFGPTVSRDGTRAAFSAFGGVQASKFEVRLMDLRSGEEANIPIQEAGINQGARLSPDGTLLAYRDRVEGKAMTLIRAQKGAAPRPLCEGCFVTGFFPANDAALVRFKPDELVRLDIRSGERTVVLSSPGDRIMDASLSPDGHWIAWHAGEPDGRAAVRITPVEGPGDGTRKTITVAEAGDFLSSPGWSPNGRWLYYLSEKNGRCSIMARELDPRTRVPLGAEREVFTTTESRLWLNFPKTNGAIAVAADKIVFEGSRMIGNIYLAKPKKR